MSLVSVFAGFWRLFLNMFCYFYYLFHYFVSVHSSKDPFRSSLSKLLCHIPSHIPLQLITLNTCRPYHPGGGYSTLVWVEVCRWDFRNATHPCTHFEGKVTHPCTKNQNFSLKFAPFWRKFRKILKSRPIKVPNLRHFGANFRKF